ncbi:MAG: HD domain-containing protein [Gemmatimonadota bacterium]
MTQRARTVRDPVWQNIRLEPHAAAILDTPEFQRLRRVKQLGFAHLVYPGAVHTRFLHAIGVYHLSGRAIRALERSGTLGEAAVTTESAALVRLSALLHDVGHYAFSHAMEELEPASIPGHHEQLAARFLEAPSIRSILVGIDPEAPRLIADLIRGASDHPLQGLVSGSLDLDKIDYLRRDSLFCGVPYGAVDVDRLLDSLTLAREREEARLEVAVTEKGISALESLLFSKYQMFRNVYWHHAVRSATVVFRRLVGDALGSGLFVAEDLPGRTDEELLSLLAARSEDRPAPPVFPALLRALRDRQLPRRVVEVLGDELPSGVASWVQSRRDLVARLEDRLADEWRRPRGSIFVDYPSNPRMLELRLLFAPGRGPVRRLTSEGEKGLIDLPRLSASLHHTTRVLRVFCLESPGRMDPAPILELLEASDEDVAARLDEDRPLY